MFEMTIDIYRDQTCGDPLGRMNHVLMPCVQIQWLTVANAGGNKKTIPVKEKWSFCGEYQGQLPMCVNGSAVFMVVHTQAGDFKSEAIAVYYNLIKEDDEITHRDDYVPKYDIEFMPFYPVKISEAVKLILIATEHHEGTKEIDM